ncbi:DNA helicase B-like [Babylonia areolata]|uniref:DNA helicase B-like n=1 Tax=Babylonia areolata TaxID=304850 RepID=UPI003FCF8105
MEKMSQGNLRKKECKTVRGYVVEVPFNKRDSSDEEDDDDEDDSWLDYSQMRQAFSQGTFVRQYKKPRYCRVKLGDLDDPKQSHTCFGRFVLLDPWWEVSVTLDANNRMEGLPEYRVRQDEDGIRRHNLVPFLLNMAVKRCPGLEDTDELMDKLEQFIRSQSKRKLSFEDVEPFLYRFTQAYPDHRDMIMKVRYQETVQAVLRGLRYPRLLQFLCRLFPLTFLTSLLSPREKTLGDLDSAAEKEPWLFGFRAIMVSQFKVFGVEANCKAFEACGLMKEIPRVQRDALYIYEVLKMDAVCEGHTYISFKELHQHRHWAQLRHTVDDWAPALAFLANNAVTKEERFNSQRNIFLYHNWKAEVDIASGMQAVLSRAIEAKEPAWVVDFASPDLSRLRGDEDQWTAAQKLVGSPICILSGKGGCGKTTVVTQMIQHVCRQTPVTEKRVPGNKDDTLANAQVREVGGADSERDRPCNALPASPQVTPEQLTDMVHTAAQALKESQAQETGRNSSQERIKRNQIQIDLTTDLIKYLGTTGNTALSKTPIGRKILLVAPTGKSAKLLGHKAKMESCTLHRVIYSYRAFVKEQEKKRIEEERSREGDGESEIGIQGNKNGPGGNNKGKVSQPQDTSEQKTKAEINSSEEEDTAATWKYAGTEVLIVDEGSLVSLRTFATLLNILIENTPLWKVVLLGDVRQLPSIEPGNFLVDMFNTFKGRGLSVELLTNHRSESELIVSNATRISNRQLPVIDPCRHFHFLAVDGSEDSPDPERDAAIRDVLVSRPELQSHETSQIVAFRRAHCDAINELCCKHYNDHRTRESKGNKCHYDFRVGDKICFRKNGQVLNHGKILRGYLQNHPGILEAFGITSAQGKNGKKKSEKVDVTTAAQQILDGYGNGNHGNLHPQRNSNSSGSTSSVPASATGRGPHLKPGSTGVDDSMVRTCAPSEDGSVGTPGSSQGADEEEERSGKLKNGHVRLCNGEMFFIMDTVTEDSQEGSKGGRFLVLSDRDPECPRVICASYLALKHECHLRHAWARTIHTYQGSESDTVVYYVGESQSQNWKHVYTAVTRGRKSVIMVGKSSELQQAVSRRDRARRSRLSRRLTDMMKDLPFQGLHAIMRGINEQAKAAKLLHIHTPPSTVTGAPSLLVPDGTGGHPDTIPPPGNSRPSPGNSRPSPGNRNPSVTDSFLDSDDSWVKELSPLWAADDQVSKDASSPAAIASNQGASPKQRQRLQGGELTPPKRLRQGNPIDSIVTPVKRSLNI